LDNADAIEAAARQILPEVRTLSAKFELIGQVGYREGRGLKLVSETVAAEFEKSFRDEVRATPIDDLAKETDLLGVLLFTKHESDQSEPVLSVHDAPEVTLAVLRSARTETRSHAMGSRAVRRSLRLAWDALVDLYGSEATLKERFERLKATRPKDADDLLVLAEKYLGGWRPKGFGDD
jgi:hypothetical protein